MRRPATSHVHPIVVGTLVVLALLAAGCGTDGDAPQGAAAAWTVADGTDLGPGTRRVPVEVTRLACNNGRTGTVLEPTVEYDDVRVVVTFTVEAVDDEADCPSNRPEPYELVLDEALGDRSLVDGQCLADGPARSTAPCGNDGVRWPPARRSR